jgi:hypothetical protein
LMMPKAPRAMSAPTASAPPGTTSMVRSITH